MSTLHQRENREIIKMIYGLDVEGIGKRISKYRLGKYVCLILFLAALAYFIVLKINESYPIPILAVFMPLFISGVFWHQERELMKAREIMIETLADEAERQNQSPQTRATSGPV